MDDLRASLQGVNYIPPYRIVGRTIMENIGKILISIVCFIIFMLILYFCL